MRPSLRRLAAASAAAYLLAGWLAAALHSHGPVSGAPAHGEEACTACSCGHAHRHGPAEGRAKPEDDRSPACPDGDCPEEGHHHCVVCDFLAKPPVAAAAVTLVTVPEPSVEVGEPLPPAYEPAVSFVSRSRGPPAA